MSENVLRALALTAVLAVAASCASPGWDSATCLPVEADPSAAPAPQAGDSAPRVGVYRRSPSEVWVYDARTELGIGIHAFNPTAVSQIQELGVRLVRQTMYWRDLETSQDRYSPEALRAWDYITSEADRAGLEMELVVHGEPEWVGGYEERDTVYAEFAEFMGDMAARYQTVRFWELWNEMDTAFTDVFGAGRRDVPMRQRGRHYAEMLKLAYPAIKDANADAWVLSGGLGATEEWTEFPSGIYEGGGAPYFDFMNIHTYSVPLIRNYRRRGLALDSVMRAYGDTARPIWNTEFGIQGGAVIDDWGMPHERDPSLDDAEVLDRVHCQAWKEALEYSRRDRLYVKALGYQLYAGNESLTERMNREANLGPGRTAHDFGFGLLRSDEETPRPAYLWLKERQYNAPIFQDSVQVVDVTVTAAPGVEPEGHESHRTEDGELVIQDVRVGSLVPTVVRLVEQRE